MKYIIGNWKCNKGEEEVRGWFKSFSEKFSQAKINLSNLTLVVAPPFLYLPLAKFLIDELKLPLKLAAQDVSPFSDGAYTGAISAKQIAQYVNYAVVGHSERRNFFSETDEMVAQKVQQLAEAGIMSIVCVQDEHTPIPDDTNIVAYEPVYAIGTGKPESPEKASRVARVVRNSSSASVVIYGGSVKPENINNYLWMDGIDGVLPGGASLIVQGYWGMVTNASQHQTQT